MAQSYLSTDRPVLKTDNRSSVTGANFLSRLCNCRPGFPYRNGKCKCITRHEPIEKPDVAIYSQLEIMKGGGIPSWNSPDIITNNWGPFKLMAEAKVIVRNISTTVSAVNALVHYFISPFGIGTVERLFATRYISLTPSSQVELLFPLDQSTLNGDQRAGVHIKIEHPNDPNLINNYGSQVHDGSFTTDSGRNFSIQIPVLNNSNFSRQIFLSILPTDIIASVAPLSHNFTPYEQILATLHIEVPSYMHGTPASYIEKEVSVIGRLSDNELIGGVTKMLRINN